MVKLSVRKVCSGYQGESLCPEFTVHRIYSIDIKANEVAIGGWGFAVKFSGMSVWSCQCVELLLPQPPPLPPCLVIPHQSITESIDLTCQSVVAVYMKYQKECTTYRISNVLQLLTIVDTTHTQTQLQIAPPPPPNKELLYYCYLWMCMNVSVCTKFKIMFDAIKQQLFLFERVWMLSNFVCSLTELTVLPLHSHLTFYEVTNW